MSLYSYTSQKISVENDMNIECFGTVGNGKTKIIYSRILTETVVNMSIIVSKASIYRRNMLR